ncbi:MAG: hypothetical protein ACI8XO_004915 [Verrucomicrobiales bacterium]|jgi:hypothetical protein
MELSRNRSAGGFLISLLHGSLLGWICLNSLEERYGRSADFSAWKNFHHALVTTTVEPRPTTLLDGLPSPFPTSP